MRIGIHSNGKNHAKLIQYCSQIGVSAVCLACSAIEGYDERGYPDSESLKVFKSALEEARISLPAMVISKRPSQEALLSKPDSENELDPLCLTLETLGKAGVETVLIYPDVDRPVSRLREEECWRGIRKFYEVLVESAESAHVKLANHAFYHPWKVIRDTRTLVRLLEEIPSPYNGVAYCQGLYQMGDNPYEAVTTFGDKIFLAHARDLRKVRYPPRFEEVFLGEGHIDIPKTLRLLEAVGYRGIVYPEHLGVQKTDQGDLQAMAIEYLKRLLSV